MIEWFGDVEDHDFDAASRYLSIRHGAMSASRSVADLRRSKVTMRRANDILRACRLDALPLDDPGVERCLRKVLKGKRLSPVLVADGDIADGYHRVSLAYRLDPFTEVPLRYV